jgi:hypothetical protein
VPVSFFFEGAPAPHRQIAGSGEAPSPAYVTDFLATTDGLTLVKAFMRIPNAKLRRRIVDLVEEMAGGGRLPDSCRFGRRGTRPQSRPTQPTS